MDKLNLAIQFATQKHAKQFRKKTAIPYIVHPIEVMQILRDNGASIDAQIVGVLHDTLEDTDTTYQEISKLFGDKIANMVQMETEIKGKAYKERKHEHMMRIMLSGTKEEKMVNCADKLSNLKSIYIDLKSNGSSTWQKFNAPREHILWYYGLSIRVFESDLKDTKMFKQLLSYYYKVYLFEANKKYSSYDANK